MGAGSDTAAEQLSPCPPAAVAATGPAALLAAAAAPTVTDAAPVAPLTAAANITAGKALASVGYTAPHAYYRGVAYMGSWIRFWGWFWVRFLLGVPEAFLPIYLTGQFIAATYQAVLNRWEQLLQPVPAYQEAASPRLRRPQTHRKRFLTWAAELVDRASRRKPLTASIRRHLQRYISSIDKHQSATAKYHAVTVATRISLGSAYSLVALLLVGMVAHTLATPDMLRGVGVLTGNLAAWEFAQLGRWRFADAALYNDLSPLPSTQVQPQQWQQLLQQHAGAADAVPTYPGAVDPLQLDDLLPGGPQFPTLKAAYTKDEEHKWCYGNHPDMSAEQQQQLKEMLVRTKSAFVYSMKELPGYTGDPVDLQLVHDRPIISKPRKYSQLELAIMQEKYDELQEAGFIAPGDPHCKYTSCPTMPAKKNELGEWVERRFRNRLSCNQCSYHHAALCARAA